jgi:DNA-binding HxlR family transcriptional regulator
MPAPRVYRHFCPLARALELVGERWGLLIVRDLLEGPLRFTDLQHTCGGITPRQLAARLRQLEEAGVVKRDPTPGRHVWYQLTPAGLDLRSAVEGLLAWGVRHAARPPAADEPVRAFHLLNGARIALNEAASRPPRPVRWTFRFPEGHYTLGFDGTSWQLDTAEHARPDVVVDTTPHEWARVVTAPDQTDGPVVRGSAKRVAEFRAAFRLRPAPNPAT